MKPRSPPRSAPADSEPERPVMIRFPCLDCRKTLSVADESTGKLAKCPNCLAKVRVPADSAPAKLLVRWLKAEARPRDEEYAERWVPARKVKELAPGSR